MCVCEGKPSARTNTPFHFLLHKYVQWHRQTFPPKPCTCPCVCILYPIHSSIHLAEGGNIGARVAALLFSFALFKERKPASPRLAMGGKKRKAGAFPLKGPTATIYYVQPPPKPRPPRPTREGECPLNNIFQPPPLSVLLLKEKAPAAAVGRGDIKGNER